MDKEPEPKPTPISQVTHFHQQIPLPPQSTIVPYRPHHTTTSKKSKKSKNKLDQFLYYRTGPNHQQIMKILFKDQTNYMLCGYYPFTEPRDEMEKGLSEKGVRKVIKAEAAYIGHQGDMLVVKKLSEVKLGEDGNEFDTIGDNFEVIKIGNKERFQQFLRILKIHPKSLQISIRVIIDESVVGEPVVIDYQFFKREMQIRNTNQKFMKPV